MENIQNTSNLVNELKDLILLKPIDTLHEDYGDVLLWRVPICDPPDVGSCLDEDFNEKNYTHWSKIPNVEVPTTILVHTKNIDKESMDY